MKNEYFFARHGRSLANEQGIILSDPVQGIAGFGLTEEGRAQVRVSIEGAKEKYALDAATSIISSDFLRARETAESIADVLGVSHTQIEFSQNLRERYFGDWEQTPDTNYPKVWYHDQHDANSTEDGVESVNSVLARMKKLIAELEERYAGKKIILISHGDPLQILQASFEHIPVAEHNTVTLLRTGEIRKVE